MTQYPIRELCDRLKSGEGINSNEVTEIGKYPVYGGNGIRGYSENYNFAGECILIGRQGVNCGSIHYFNGTGYMTEHAIVVCTNDKCNVKYLGYMLRLLKLGRLSTQAAQPGISVKLVGRQIIDLPSRIDQDNIANILFTYDQLIENNTRRIALLEKMAQELYKEWFVRFRFPGHEHVKIVNGVPDGWRIKRLYEFGRIETGKTPSTENPENYGNEILFVKTPDMHENMYVLSTEEKLSNVGHETQPKKLIPANSIMVTCIGTAGIVAINTEKVHTNQQINSIILDNQYNLEWLYFACKNLKETIELFGSNGATMTNLNKGKFEKLKVLSPSEKLVNIYHNSTLPMFNEIKQLEYKNKNLRKQRDFLLPRLMSGKLKLAETS